MVGSILSEENYSEVIIDRKKWFIFIAILLRSIDSGVKSYPFWSGFLFRSNKWRKKVTRFDRFSIHFDPFCYSEVRIGGKKLLVLIRFSTRFDPIFCSRIKSDQDELQNRIKMSCKIAQFELQLRLMLMRKNIHFEPK